MMEALKRLRLFKKLDPNFEIDKIVTVTKEFVYDFKNILPGTYLVSKPFGSPISSNTIVAIVNLEDTMEGHDEHISDEAFDEGFTCWNIRLDYFNNIKGIKDYYKSLNFLYEGGDKVD